MNMMLLLVIYAVAIVGYVVFSRRRQAKAQEDRFAGLAKGAEVRSSHSQKKLLTNGMRATQ